MAKTILKFSLGGAGASIVVKDNVSTSDKVYYGTGAAGSGGSEIAGTGGTGGGTAGTGGGTGAPAPARVFTKIEDENDPMLRDIRMVLESAIQELAA